MGFDDALRFTLQYEGGYSNDPDDPGGATNKGITQRTYDAHRAATGLARAHVKTITQGEVEEIYRRDYWGKAHCDSLPGRLAVAVFDTAVNCGVSRAAKWLQKAVCAKADGVIGPKTIEAAAGTDEHQAIKDFLDLRLNHYDDIIAANHKLAKFERGWTNRVNALRRVLAV